MTRNLGALAFATTLALLAGRASASPAEAERPGIAIVYGLEGAGVTVEKAGGLDRRSVSRFDWLAAGTTLRVGKRARAWVALNSGRRFELREGATLTLAADGTPDPKGQVVSLPPVPPLPRFSRQARSPGSEGFGDPVRNAEKPALHPSGSESSVAHETVLRFPWPAGRKDVSVSVENERGEVLFQVPASRDRAPVPAGVLKHGRTYWWSVTNGSGQQLEAYGQAKFHTVDEDVVRFRDELKRRASHPDEGSLNDLLHELNRLWRIVPAEDPPVLGASEVVATRKVSKGHAGK